MKKLKSFFLLKKKSSSPHNIKQKYRISLLLYQRSDPTFRNLSS